MRPHVDTIMRDMNVLPHYREGRKKPYEARWWINRRPKSKFFITEKERDRFIRDFTNEIGEHGAEVFRFDKQRQRRWQEADRLYPGIDPVQALKFWHEHHQRQEGSVSLNEGVTRYLRDMELAELSPEYRNHAQTMLKRFCGQYGETLVSMITTEQISDYVHRLPYASITKRHARSFLNTAFKSFEKLGWIDRNPVVAVPLPRLEQSEPGILTVEETEALFRASEKIDPAICGLLALGAFAGMRSSAIERLTYDELDFQNRSILTKASKTKKRRRHYIQKLPDNLWAWLERTPKSAFKMTPRQIRQHRLKAFQRAGLILTKGQARKLGVSPKLPPKNCLRHSFVSYHVAAYQNPGSTALIISHKNQIVLWNHYLGVARYDDANRYFKLRPENK